MKKDKNTAQEVKEKAPKAPLTPEKKRKRRRRIIFAVIAVLAILALILYMRKKNNPITPVETAAVEKGDIEVILSYSGTINSSEEKSYYANLTGIVSEMNLHVGDRVSKGDLLYRYDQDDLDLMKEKASLTQDQAEGNYNGSLQRNYISTINSNGMSLTQINARIDEITAQTDALNAQINEKTARMSRTLTDLQKTAMDVDQNNISDSTDAANGNNAPNTRQNDEGHQMSLEIQNAMSEVQYALSYDPEIQSWKNQINALAEEKSKLLEASAAESARMTSGDREALDAQKALTELDSSDTIASIEKVEGGITSDLSGVITELNVAEGATVSQGSRLITISGTDNVHIDIQISKTDLDKIQLGQKVDITIRGKQYTGEVAQIAGAATKNANGVPVVAAQISVDDPDDNVILGTEATVKIHSDKVEGVPVLPYEYISTDADGDFVYMVGDDFTLIRRDVTLGLSTSTDAEITGGLNIGDKVVTTNADTLSEGMTVIVTAEE
ncbi:MAG: efflux RND transporter periplasmic adaptor subunit [Lachnospiraceae bacterium]|nr:efflux RND transporter periplasmic adaptor subunit [Lachnospiraceae bacterium]